MDPSHSIAALQVAQGACASDRRLIGRIPSLDSPGGMSGVALDTPRFKEALGALRAKPAQDGVRREDEFLAMLAHELRSPLSAIRSALAILGQSKAAPQSLEVARGMIGRQVRNMGRLIDDLLDVSRIAHGKMHLQKELVNLATVVESAIETCLPLIESRQHIIEVDVPEEPILLEADPGRLEQVLSNLLNNAAKYTEPGGRLCISASLEGGQAVLRIKDTGIGMTGETLSKVFDLFVQADRSLARSQGGLGIGLTMVKSLVEMHGGTVKAESHGLGRGSEFTVRLPASSGIVAAPPWSHATYPHRERLRILVVDDNMDATDGLTLLLKLSGHDVRAAYRGDEALLAAKAFLPEVVLLDIGLPGMDGYEVARRLRAEKSLARVRLIAVSGYGHEEDRIRSQEAGFDHHVMKPIDMNLVKALLSACFCLGLGRQAGH